MVSRASPGVLRQWTLPPLAVHLALEPLQVEVEVASMWFLMSRALSRSASNSGSALDRRAARVREAGLRSCPAPSAERSSASARAALSLNVGRGLICMAALTPRFADRRRRRVMPARISATCRTLIVVPFALQLARHVHQAAHVAGQQRVGAGARRYRSAFSPTILLEMSGYLMQKVPPKPQQTSASGSSVSVSPSTAAAGSAAAA